MTLGEMLDALKEITQRLVRNERIMGATMSRYIELKGELCAALCRQLQVRNIDEARALPSDTAMGERVKNLFASLSRHAAAF